ncbi:MAG: hypothetical protein A2078_02215 [Nitrospirae bacterium GWC2_57_9]|nr:MAG: hypothetical protein A2078_02215 [Nitrospirae bacterium GWC2_57_9]
MRQIRAIIADDEEALRSYLKKKLLSAWPELAITGEAGDGPAALRLIADSRPDIAFLDVQMPGATGLEVARRIAGTCAVVFVTAYNKYAVEAFESEALDYLLKPVTDERIEKTVKRLKERLNTPHLSAASVSEAIEKIAFALQKPAVFLQWIKAQHKGGVRLIPVNEICYFKATDKYTTVRTRDGEFLIRKTIKELEEELEPGQFWRVHRSAIVNVRAIQTVADSLSGSCMIKFKDIQEDLSVSRAYSHLFRQM